VLPAADTADEFLDGATLVAGRRVMRIDPEVWQDWPPGGAYVDVAAYSFAIEKLVRRTSR
jgi:hypothetical protein